MEEKRQYQHHVSYIIDGSRQGCSIIQNNLESYKTSEEVNKISKFIEEQSKVEDIIITNILTFKNE